MHYLQKMIGSGAFGIEPPQNLAAMFADIRRWGEVGMIPALNARRAPNRLAIIDDEGSITNSELNDAVNAVANGLLAMGVRGGDGVAVLARNHRWFSIANYACARVGARTIGTLRVGVPAGWRGSKRVAVTASGRARLARVRTTVASVRTTPRDGTTGRTTTGRIRIMRG